MTLVRGFGKLFSKCNTGNFKIAMPYYAVARGRNPGIYESWGLCEQEVKQFSGARYKKFNSHEAAAEFVQEHSAGVLHHQPSSGASSSTNATSTHTSGYSGQCQKTSTPKAQHPKTRYMPNKNIEQLQETTASLLEQSRQLYNRNMNHTATMKVNEIVSSTAKIKASCAELTALLDKKQAAGGRKRKHNPDVGSSYGKQSRIATHESPVVFTDGACFNNGRGGATAGIGVFWGHNHPMNTSERLLGRPTNNRAEIHAACKAVEQAKNCGYQQLELRTDSMFMINSMTKWIHKWKRNGWKLADGKPVINKDDFEKLDQLSQGININYVHVRGHVGIEGNEAADRLANEGARKPLS